MYYGIIKLICLLSCGIQKYVFDKRTIVVLLKTLSKLLFYVINIYSVENIAAVKKYMKLTY